MKVMIPIGNSKNDGQERRGSKHPPARAPFQTNEEQRQRRRAPKGWPKMNLEHPENILLIQRSKAVQFLLLQPECQAHLDLEQNSKVTKLQQKEVDRL